MTDVVRSGPRPSPLEAHEWWEHYVVENEPQVRVHRIEVVGCSHCGWEVPAWPDETAELSAAHQEKHRRRVYTALIESFTPLVLSGELADLAIEVVLEAVREPVES